jgi:cytochrome c-type biogenesis protein CcmH/NrfG
MRGPALPAVLLLFVFFTVVPTIGERTRPAEQPLDCSQVTPDDVPTLERCIERQPGNVELLADLGGAYERSSLWDRAEGAYRRALEIDAEDGDIRVRLAQILLRRGDMDGARREGTAALALQPGRAAALDVVRRATPGEAGQ